MNNKADNTFDEFLKDNQNIINMDNPTILERDIFEEMTVKAIIILLTKMKLKTMELKDSLTGAENIETSPIIREFEDIEEQYRFFETRMDEAFTDEQVKEELKEKAREILEVSV